MNKNNIEKESKNDTLYAQNLRKKYKHTMHSHFSMSQHLKSALDAAGYNVDLLAEIKVNKQHIIDQDLVISFGGDVTYLSTARYIEGPQTAYLGINSHPELKSSKFL